MFKIYSHKERPDLYTAQNPELEGIWEEFSFHSDYGEGNWDVLMSDFAEFQEYGLEDDKLLISMSNNIPLHWSGADDDLPAGWDEAVKMGCKAEREPNTLCALSVAVAKNRRGQGIAGKVLQYKKQLALDHGYKALIVPVRPTMKSLYPLILMEDYLSWKDERGRCFDPWVRTHLRLGARIAGVCEQSMIIKGTIDQWEQWTKMKFPQTGRYTVKGALHPIDVDVEKDSVSYIEANVWMVYEL